MYHWHHYVVVLAALGSALAFSFSSYLKHLSAGDVPEASGSGVGGFGRFVRSTLAHPLWLGGIGADVLGLTLQLVALHFGALAVVQPLMITGLVWALILRQRHYGRVSRREIAWAAVVVGCLAGFLATAHIRPPADGKGVDRLPAVLACVVGVLLGVLCVLIARRLGGQRSAALIGVAVGATYAATAALLKTLTDIALSNPLHLFVSWQLYATVLLGATGMLLNQMAFQAGPLTASLPAIATVDPLLSVVIGVWLYDERLRHAPWAVTLEVGLLLILVTAIVRLVRAERSDPPVELPAPSPARLRRGPQRARGLVRAGRRSGTRADRGRP